ncbi:MAG TPA: amidase [Terriglobales bacterium]|nr:amidase [Terriglobales bacterium]
MSSASLDLSHLHQLSVARMAHLIRERKLSPVEVVRAHYARIEHLNPKLNAFIELRQEAALAEAQAAEQPLIRGAKLGPLHGVPVSIKSSIAVAGLKFECGSPTLKAIVANEDAVLVRRLKQAGAIVLGNTNVPEMLMAYETRNPLYGRTNSAWDLSRTPGGSSGGEAAAISAGLCAAGIGSDGGGSIRVPAHFSGICGLKPTPGRIPVTGHWPESGGPFALLGVVGPMARSVQDLEIIFRAIAGFDSGDPMAAPIPLTEIHEHELRRITIGYFEEHPSVPVTAETRAAVQSAVSALQKSGLRVRRFLPDVLLNESREHWWTLFVRLAAELLTPEFKGRENEISTILTYSDRRPSKEDLLTAWFGRDELRLRLMRQMKDVPVLICPVCSVPAFRHGEREWEIDGQSVSYMDAMSYTQWFNLLGNPAVVVPVGVSPEGLPIGVQVVGQPNSEELILKIARALEEAVGPRKLAPMMFESSIASA